MRDAHAQYRKIPSEKISRFLAMSALVTTLTIAGCTGPRTEQTRVDLLGKTKEQILACAGAPLVEAKENDLVILVYYREASILEEAFAQAKSTFPKVHHGCRARLGLQDNHVIGVEYRSVPDTYQDEDHCEEIFAQCR